MPYTWFLALEQPGKMDLFSTPAHIRSFGYLPRSPDLYGNPDGLPIGFVRDVPFKDGTPSLGFSCAACHTTQITHGNVAYLIDGGPTLGDVESFLRTLAAALKETAEDEAKFGRFADRLVAGLPDAEKAVLRDRLRGVVKERVEYNQRNLPADGAPRFGHGRVDAFGAILNQVTVAFIKQPGNVKPADAPVSYPFLWDTPQHKKVQWNGTASNLSFGPLKYVLGTKHVGALGRNAGEVLGVFGNVSVGNSFGYASSVDHDNLIAIEESLRKLWSPQWPQEELGKLDKSKVDRGRAIFRRKNSCASCHTDPFDRASENREVGELMLDVGTDERMYQRFDKRRAAHHFIPHSGRSAHRKIHLRCARTRRHILRCYGQRAEIHPGPCRSS